MYDRYREWKQWIPEEFGKCGLADAVYFCSELNAAGVPCLRQMHVLEIGFGGGAFARWAIDNGANYIGVERIPELVTRGREVGFDVRVANPTLDCLSESKNALDIVVAFDVFEHLSIAELTALLRVLHDLLTESGRLIARLPSGDSPFARAIQHGDLTHQSIIGSSAVRQVAISTGFRVEQIREPSFPLLGLGALATVRRSFITLIRALVYPVIERVFMGGGRFVLTPNMLVVFSKQTTRSEQNANE